MKTLMNTIVAALVALALVGGAALAQDEQETPAQQEEIQALEHVDQCVACHTENDNLPEHYLAADIHMKPGLSCSGCHGGDPTSDDADVAMSPKAGFVGVPARADIPAFCGKCHSDIEFMRRYQPRIATDQVSQYATSVHGQRLKQGDKKVAVCTSCHTTHSILPASDARSSVYAINVPATCNHCHGDADFMAPYSIPTNQYAKYAKSVHGKALLENQDTGAPACNDCHGNHGATPPGVASIRQVCGHCHVNNAQFFTASKMGSAWEKQGLHGCEECHGNHDIEKPSDNMVGTQEGAVCMDCHEDGDKGFAAAGRIHEELTTLVTAYDDAATRQKEVQRIGMDDEEIVFTLQEAHQSLIQSRTLVHTFDPEKVGAQTQEGLAKAQSASEMAVALIRDYHVRRRGLGFATLFTTILVLALFLKVRNMETK